MTYRGKFMSRAARLAHKAEAGSVLCTAMTWNQAQAVAAGGGGAGGSGELAGSSLLWARAKASGGALAGRYVGSMSLKGVPKLVHVYDCGRWALGGGLGGGWGFRGLRV